MSIPVKPYLLHALLIYTELDFEKSTKWLLYHTIQPFHCKQLISIPALEQRGILVLLMMSFV